MMQTPQTQDKSLLVQTVALFEALLGKINQLQEENNSFKKVSNKVHTYIDSIPEKNMIGLILINTG